MWLPNALIAEVEDTVKVFYVNYATTRLWAEHREQGEPLVFSGWYWARGPVERLVPSNRGRLATAMPGSAWSSSAPRQCCSRKPSKPNAS
jgi:hypothetical protein